MGLGRPWSMVDQGLLLGAFPETRLLLRLPQLGELPQADLGDVHGVPGQGLASVPRPSQGRLPKSRENAVEGRTSDDVRTDSSASALRSAGVAAGK